MEKQKHLIKDDLKDRIEIEVGDYKQPDFKPQIKMMRWDNEVNYSVRLKNWNKDKIDLEFYDHEEGFKFIWYLKEKPESNIVEFTLQSKGVDFYYQPELSQEAKDRGDIRPENVVGSYAIYHSTKGGMNDSRGMEYKCGKVGHIFRPHLYDADGKECWGILHIDKEAGTYTVEIPQEFLDNAVYPIKSNDTFGYTSLGGTDSFDLARFGGSSYISGEAHNLGIAGTLDSIKLGLRATSSTQTLDMYAALYREDSAGADSHNLVVGIERAEGADDVTTSAAWFTFTGSSESLSADDYIIVALGNAAGLTAGDVSLRSDEVDPLRRYNDSGLYATLKAVDPWNEDDAADNTNWSMYVTYTPAVLTVTTQAASDVTSTTATANGNITDVGAENADKRGFVYDDASHDLPEGSESLVDTESFDNTFGDWVNDAGVGSNCLQFDTNNTGSGNTGPSAPQDGTHYVYYETSSSACNGGNWDSMTYTLSETTGGHVDFYYHMYGADIGILTLEAYDGVGWTAFLTKNGQQEQTDELDPWTHVTDAVFPSNTEKIRFYYTGATGFAGDAGIDLVKVYEGGAAPAPGDTDYEWFTTEEGNYGTGAFTGSLEDLDPSTTYYVRAWAWQATDGYVYGDEIEFTTEAEGGTTYRATITDVISILEVPDPVTGLDFSVRANWRKVISDIMALVDNLAPRAVFRKSISDTIELVDNLTLTVYFRKAISDTITLIDNISKRANFRKIISDSITLVDSLTTRLLDLFRVTISDTITLVDNLSKKTNFRKSVLDSIVLVDSFIADFTGTFRQTITDTITLVDNISKKVSFRKSISDSIILVDNFLAQIRDIFRVTISDSITLVDSFTIRLLDIFRATITDTITLVDSLSKRATFRKTQSDVITLVDTLTKRISFRKAISDTMTLVDSFIAKFRGTFRQVISDSVSLVDTLATSYRKVWRWDEVIKSITNWTNKSKNTTSYTGQTKNTTSFTNQSKNTTAYTKQSKNTSNWTNQSKS